MDEDGKKERSQIVAVFACVVIFGIIIATCLLPDVCCVVTFHFIGLL